MNKGDRKERRIKIIGLLLSILAILLSFCLLAFLVKHVILLCLCGLISIAFFYRILFYKTPEERKAGKEANARQEAERKQWEYHKFYRISERARAAYLILCLEETIKFYGQDIQKWEWVLKKLWEITTADSESNWVFDVHDLYPCEVLPYATYEDMKEAYTTYGRSGERFEYLSLSAEQFVYLQDLYSGAGSILGIIENLIDNISNVIFDEWGEYETPYSPTALQYIDQTEQLLGEKHIPLPHDEQALQFLMLQKDKHGGKPFDGLRFSALYTSKVLGSLEQEEP